MTSHILLWLESPLQSWGFDSLFDRRDSLSFPTKSGILGIVLCAMGESGSQEALLAQFADLDLVVHSFAPEEKHTMLRDFHMVGSGYNNKDAWESRMIPKTSDGKKAVGGGAKLTHRYYLQGARFAVILEVPNTLSDRISEALQCPVYDLYLGRKSCVPTDFIFHGQYHSENEAWARICSLLEEKNKDIPDNEKSRRELVWQFAVRNGRCEDGEHVLLHDVPVSFGQTKQYRHRYVTISRKQ